MASGNVTKAALPSRGDLRITLSDEDKPGWLKMDGTTEYDRAMYPMFIGQFGSAAWLLAGSTADKFKLLDVRKVSLASSGPDRKAGTIVGSDTVKLTTANLPPHDHDYNAPTTATTTQQVATGGLLGLLLATLSLARPGATATAKTGSTGAAEPIPILPKSLVVNVYIFAGVSGLRMSR